MNKPFQKTMFSPLHEEAPYIHMTPIWQQHEDLVAHLCQFSQNILLVVAPQSGGKTTFLQHFLDKPTPGLHKRVLTAKAQMTTQEWVHQLMKVFDLNNDNPAMLKPLLLAAMEAHYTQNQITWTLFIDDAHLLNNEQLQIVLHLVNFKAPPHQQLRLVLLGEPSLELRLFSPEFTSIAQGKIYTIELQSWTFQDVQDYLAKEGFSFGANKDQIASIFERSRGLPGYVVREKNAVLGLLSTAGKKMSKRPFTLWGLHPISLGVMAGLIMGGGYLLFNHSGDEEGISAPLNAASPAVAFHFDKIDTSDVVEEDRVADNTPPPPVQEKIKEVVAVEPVAPVAPKTLVQQVSKKALKPLKPEETQMLSVSKNRYTLQLLASSNEKSVKAFIQQHAIAGKSHYVKTKRGGKDWYVVVYGEYPTESAAKKAAKSMPASLRQAKVQPWVREL